MANGKRFRMEEDHSEAEAEDEVKAADVAKDEAARPLHRPPLLHRGSESMDDSPLRTHHTAGTYR